MFIRDKKNKVVINLSLCTGFVKQINYKLRLFKDPKVESYSIVFYFHTATSTWFFDTKEECEEVFEKIMSIKQ